MCNHYLLCFKVKFGEWKAPSHDASIEWIHGEDFISSSVLYTVEIISIRSNNCANHSIPVSILSDSEVCNKKRTIQRWRLFVVLDMHSL